jgi:aspartate aminotransferase
MAITAPLPVVTIEQQETPNSPPERIGVSATLAANEALDERRRRGERVLPLAFGEAGVPVAPVLRDALADASHLGGYGPVAGSSELRTAAAGYWSRRGLPTVPDDVVCGPGSKALLYGLLLNLGADVAIPRPSWVSYAAQASLTGIRPVYVPIVAGQGGVPDPHLLSLAVAAARREGRRIGAVIVTLPDNPTGTLAPPDTIRGLCAVAERHDLLIIADEIYRDLTHAGGDFLSPAELAPDRTVITSGLSKNLALGGWRLGVARLPGGAPRGAVLRSALLAAGSEIWSAPAAPVQAAAALAFGEPAEITARVARSRHLHGAIARAVASLLSAAGVAVAPPQGAFYLYPDFAAHRRTLRRRFSVRTSADLAGLLLRGYGVGVLPGSAFGDPADALRLRVATSRLYGEAEWQQEAALGAEDPAALPWIADSLAWLERALAAITALSRLRRCAVAPLCGGRGRAGARQGEHDDGRAPGQPLDRDHLEQPPAHHDDRARGHPQRRRGADADRERVVVARGEADGHELGKVAELGEEHHDEGHRRDRPEPVAHPVAVRFPGGAGVFSGAVPPQHHGPGRERGGREGLHRAMGQQAERAAGGDRQRHLGREGGGGAREDEAGPVPAAQDQAGQHGFVRKFGGQHGQEGRNRGGQVHPGNSVGPGRPAIAGRTRDLRHGSMVLRPKVSLGPSRRRSGRRGVPGGYRASSPAGPRGTAPRAPGPAGRPVLACRTARPRLSASRRRSYSPSRAPS